MDTPLICSYVPSQKWQKWEYAVPLREIYCRMSKMNGDLEHTSQMMMMVWCFKHLPTLFKPEKELVGDFVSSMEQIVHESMSTLVGDFVSFRREGEKG